MARNALVRPTPPYAAVLPTPLWEFAVALLIGWIIWRLGRRAKPLGWLTGLYLVLSGVARFLVEFYRLNPPIYFHKTLSNAQVAAVASALVGIILLVAVRKNPPVGGAALVPPPDVMQPASSSV